MRIIHTADWHLGRVFHEVNLTEDQSHVLDQMVQIIEDEKPDAVLVSGDIYDRSIPPVVATELLSDVLARIIKGAKVPVFMIAGNHDSGERLAFGAELFEGQGLYVSGPVGAQRNIRMSDEHGEIDIVMMPYAQAEHVRSEGMDEDARTHDDAIAAQVARSHNNGLASRSIALAHAFVENMLESDSERLLSVGGTGTVSANHFSSYSYTALGHLHGPQKVSEGVWYSGSILKYSFSEADHHKGCVIAEIDGAGNASTSFIELTPRRDLRRVEGLFQDLIKSTGSRKEREDYIEFNLLDKSLVLDAMARIREVYPNAMVVRRPQQELRSDAPLHVGDRRKVNPQELFAGFFEYVTNEKIAKPEQEAFATTLQQVESIEEEGR
jgi:exonuclease SbcD